MAASTIVFSSQFGGHDAADAVLPHFWALKAASHGLQLEGFPLPELAFILRVDGKVNTYPPTADGNLDLDRKGKYLSVDIEISIEGRDRIVDAVSEAILSSVEKIKSHKKVKRLDIDYETLEACLLQLISRYKDGSQR